MSKRKAIEPTNNTNDIRMIPLDKIVPCRWGTGIRDPKKYKLLKQNMKEHGLNNPVKVRPNGGDTFEPYIGDHRVMAAKELKWKKILCNIQKINDDTALEMCISDNTCRADYSCVELENKVTELWNSSRYDSKAKLGRKIGLSGERIGQLILAKEIRDKSEGTLDATISTQTILDSRALESDEDKVALLTKVKDKKVKPSEVKSMAKKLSKLDFEKRNEVLYENKPLETISTEIKTNVDNKMPSKDKTSTKTNKTANANLLPELYEVIKELGNYVALLDDKGRESAIKYLKFCIGLQLEVLTKHDELPKGTFDTFVEKALKIDASIMHNFDGVRTEGIEWYF